MRHLKTIDQLNESVKGTFIGGEKTSYTLRYCDYDPSKTYDKDYPILLKTENLKELEDYIDKNYPKAKKMEVMAGNDWGRAYRKAELPYLSIIQTPYQKHSYIISFAVDPDLLKK